MASLTSGSDSGSDPYGYDLTLSDEEELIAVIDSIPPPPTVRSSASRPVPTPKTASRSCHAPPSVAESASSLDNHLKQAIEVHETVENITEGDLNFDPAELGSERAYSHGSGSEAGFGVALDKPPPAFKKRLAASVSSGDASLSSFVSDTRPKSMPRVLSGGPDICYPDLTRALSDAQKSSYAPSRSEAETSSSGELRSPLLRFRTSPMKPLSVSDLAAGSWCELQHFYTLTRLGGKKTKTEAMKGGTEIHEKLEREKFTIVEVEIRKREDNFGLKIWNIIQVLRTLRDTGLTREVEVWGIVDGNVVNGIIDGLSYENPDPEFEEDVISSRGSQASQSSQHQLSLGNKTIFLTDVKTRQTKTLPSQPQVRVALVQLFLYHRFLSQMASGRLDYLKVFKRYGLNPDETFSDVFMADIADLHEEVFSDIDSGATDITGTTADFVSAVSSPSQLGDRHEDATFTKYRTLRSLLPLLKFEFQLTFPRGAATLGQVVAVEYRFRRQGDDDPNAGSVICRNSFYFEPEKLDAYLEDNMQWWRGEREPRGVPLEEGFKCRSCEFVDGCEWRTHLEQEAHRKARLENAEREGAARRKKKMSSVEW